MNIELESPHHRGDSNLDEDLADLAASAVGAGLVYQHGTDRGAVWAWTSTALAEALKALPAWASISFHLEFE